MDPEGAVHSFAAHMVSIIASTSMSSGRYIPFLYVKRWQQKLYYDSEAADPQRARSGCASCGANDGIGTITWVGSVRFRARCVSAGSFVSQQALTMSGMFSNVLANELNFMSP